MPRAGAIIPNMQSYDVFYKKLINAVPLKNVTSRFAMEKIKSITALPIPLVVPDQEAGRRRACPTPSGWVTTARYQHARIASVVRLVRRITRSSDEVAAAPLEWRPGGCMLAI